MPEPLATVVATVLPSYVIVIAESGLNPPPVTVTGVPTKPIFLESVIEEPVDVPSVIVIVGGCSTSCHSPVAVPLFEYIGFVPEKVATTPYQVTSSGVLNATEPRDVTGSSSIEGALLFTFKAPVASPAIESKV